MIGGALVSGLALAGCRSSDPSVAGVPAVYCFWYWQCRRIDCCSDDVDYPVVPGPQRSMALAIASTAYPWAA